MKWWLPFAILLVHSSLTFAFDDDDDDSSEFGVVDGDVGTNCTCGYANKEGQRIIGGEEAKVNEWPMIAEFSVQGDHFCGGTVVTQRHVITASHCGFFPKTLEKLPYDMIDVFVGIHEVRGGKAFTGGQRFGIEKFVAHPKYHYIGKEHDVAVVYLDDAIDFSERNAAPACLPLGNEKIFGDKLKVLGWGLPKYRAAEGTKVLMKVDIKAIDHELCKVTYKYYNTQTNICMYSKNKDACQGDSGGPLLWRDPETNRYVLVAATSYGRKCGEYAAVNANIIYFLPWIQSVIAATDPTMKTCAKLTS